MTCQHCVASVTEEITELLGVRSVDVDLPSGRVVVTAERPIEPGVPRAAVERAGFRLLVPAAH